MKKEFLFNLVLLVFINLLIKPVFIFGIDLGVQNALGAQYGLYFALLNLSYLTQIINDFGIQSFNNRHVSQHPHLMPKYFPNLVALKGGLSLVYVLITLAVAWWGLGYEAEVIPLLLVLLLNQVFVQFILFLRSNISGLGFYRTDSLLSALDKLLMLVTCGGVLWWKWAPLTLMNFALAQTLALALTLGTVTILLIRLSGLPWAGRWRTGRPTFFLLFRQSYPYALAVLLMFAYTRLDAVLLERMSGPIHADVFAGAFRLLEACNMFGFLFASLLLPMFARLIRQKMPVRPLVGLSFKLIWAGSFSLTTAIFFARADLLHWMMPERLTEERVLVLGWLIWAFVPVSVTYIFSTLLTARERLMRMNRFFLIGIAIDLSLNLWLIPKYHALGAAFSALVTQCFIALSMVYLSIVEFNFDRFNSSFVRLALYSFFVILTGWWATGWLQTHWAVHFMVVLAAGAVGIFIFGLFRFNQVTQILSAGGLLKAPDDKQT